MAWNKSEIVFLLCSIFVVLLSCLGLFFFYNLLMHFLLLIVFFGSLAHVLRKSKKEMKYFWWLVFFLLIFWLLNASKINQLEFWGDEIGVIRVSSLRFEQVASTAMKSHASAPPLDYWNLAIWQKLFATANYGFYELIFRIPYIFYHSLSALIFSATVCCVHREKHLGNIKSKTNTWQADLISLTAFFVYFLNPFLFFYSLEIRFYALAILGVVITWFLFQTNELTKLKYLPLGLVLGLNSVFHFLFIFPLYLFLLFKEKNKRVMILVQLCFYLLMGLMIYSHLSAPPPLSEEQSLEMIIKAFANFWKIQFLSIWQYLILIMAAIFLLMKKLRPSLGKIFLLTYYFTSISVVAYSQKYFDFQPRHYIFTIPLIIYMIFESLRFMKTKMLIVSLIAIFFFYFLPWTKNSIQNLNLATMFSKDFLRAKATSIWVKENDLSVAFLKPDQEINWPVYDFYINSFKWYFDLYNIEYDKQVSNFIDCQQLRESQKNWLAIGVNKKINCPDFETEEFGKTTLFVYQTSCKK